jgi:hypothetical protein
VFVIAGQNDGARLVGEPEARRLKLLNHDVGSGLDVLGLNDTLDAHVRFSLALKITARIASTFGETA